MLLYFSPNNEELIRPNIVARMDKYILNQLGVFYLYGKKLRTHQFLGDQL